MRQQTARKKLEVGNRSLPEFEEIGKRGCRKLGDVADKELVIRPYYLANVSWWQQAVGNNNVALLGTRVSKLKKLIVVEKAE